MINPSTRYTGKSSCDNLYYSDSEFNENHYFPSLKSTNETQKSNIQTFSVMRLYTFDYSTMLYKGFNSDLFQNTQIAGLLSLLWKNTKIPDYFIKGLIILLEKPYILRRLFISKSNNQDLIDKNACYVSLYQKGILKEVFIDMCIPFKDEITCGNNDNYLENQMNILQKIKDYRIEWIYLLYKAYAKLHGSFEAIQNGSILNLIIELAGADYREYIHDKKQNIWDILNASIMDYNIVLGISFDSFEIYKIIEIKIFSDNAKMVKIHDPNNFLRNKYLDILPLDLQKMINLNKQDKSFWLPYQKYLEEFKSSIWICIPNYKKQFFNSIIIPQEYEFSTTLIQLNTNDDTELILSISQNIDKVLSQNNERYTPKSNHMDAYYRMIIARISKNNQLEYLDGKGSNHPLDIKVFIPEGCYIILVEIHKKCDVIEYFTFGCESEKEVKLSKIDKVDSIESNRFHNDLLEYLILDRLKFTETIDNDMEVCDFVNEELYSRKVGIKDGVMFFLIMNKSTNFIDANLELKQQGLEFCLTSAISDNMPTNLNFSYKIAPKSQKLMLFRINSIQYTYNYKFTLLKSQNSSGKPEKNEFIPLTFSSFDPLKFINLNLESCKNINDIPTSSYNINSHLKYSSNEGQNYDDNSPTLPKRVLGIETTPSTKTIAKVDGFANQKSMKFLIQLKNFQRAMMFHAMIKILHLTHGPIFALGQILYYRKIQKPLRRAFETLRIAKLNNHAKCKSEDRLIKRANSLKEKLHSRVRCSRRHLLSHDSSSEFLNKSPKLLIESSKKEKIDDFPDQKNCASNKLDKYIANENSIRRLYSTLNRFRFNFLSTAFIAIFEKSNRLAALKNDKIQSSSGKCLNKNTQNKAGYELVSKTQKIGLQNNKNLLCEEILGSTKTTKDLPVIYNPNTSLMKPDNNEKGLKDTENEGDAKKSKKFDKFDILKIPIKSMNQMKENRKSHHKTSKSISIESQNLSNGINDSLQKQDNILQKISENCQVFELSPNRNQFASDSKPFKKPTLDIENNIQSALCINLKGSITERPNHLNNINEISPNGVNDISPLRISKKIKYKRPPSWDPLKFAKLNLKPQKSPESLKNLLNSKPNSHIKTSNDTLFNPCDEFEVGLPLNIENPPNFFGSLSTNPFSSENSPSVKRQNIIDTNPTVEDMPITQMKSPTFNTLSVSQDLTPSIAPKEKSEKDEHGNQKMNEIHYTITKSSLQSDKWDCGSPLLNSKFTIFDNYLKKNLPSPIKHTTSQNEINSLDSIFSNANKKKILPARLIDLILNKPTRMSFIEMQNHVYKETKIFKKRYIINKLMIIVSKRHLSYAFNILRLKLKDQNEKKYNELILKHIEHMKNANMIMDTIEALRKKRLVEALRKILFSSWERKKEEEIKYKIDETVKKQGAIMMSSILKILKKNNVESDILSFIKNRMSQIYNNGSMISQKKNLPPLACTKPISKHSTLKIGKQIIWYLVQMVYIRTKYFNHNVKLDQTHILKSRLLENYIPKIINLGRA